MLSNSCLVFVLFVLAGLHERVPYWLNGVTPLGYLLNHTLVIGQVRRCFFVMLFLSFQLLAVIIVCVVVMMIVCAVFMCCSQLHVRCADFVLVRGLKLCDLLSDAPLCLRSKSFICVCLLRGCCPQLLRFCGACSREMLLQTEQSPVSLLNLLGC